MKTSTLAVTLSLFALLPFHATPSPTASPFSISVEPAYQYPVGPNGELFASGGRGRLSLEYDLPIDASLVARAGLGYSFAAYRVSGSGSLSSLSAELGAAWRLPIAASLGARLFAQGGLAWGFENGSGDSSGIANGLAFGLVEGGAGVDWVVAPSLSLRLDASYRYEFGLLGSAGLSLGAVWRIPERAAGGPGLGPRLIEFRDLKLGSVFPVFQAWYDENPVGTVTLSNVGKSPAKDIKLSFLIKQYMDAPKACATIELLKPGESRTLPLYAVFNGSILDVTEATKATAEVIADYRAGEEAASQSATASVSVFDRNAMTWDDDRKAAAFVSGKDPWVLVLSNQVASISKPLRNAALDRNLQFALAFHETLRLYGLSYTSSPTNPFAAAKANPEIVDFLKFPRQTLAYRTGDCADLSILYASMLESVGVETAFITVPGHILMALALDTGSEQAARLSGAGDLIMRGGKAWLPIEATLRDADFTGAWAEGARQWRENEAAGTAAFYPIREAWTTYQPVGLPADTSAVAVPEAERIAKAFSTVLALLVDRELAFRIAPIEAAMKQNGRTPKALNGRGVVYASLGKLDLAIDDFRAAGAGGEYVPALANLGNVFLLKGDAQSAYDAHRRAAEAAPGNARILANLAKAAALMGNAEEASAILARAKALDPALAVKIAPAPPAASEGSRAAEAEEGLDLLWIQE